MFVILQLKNISKESVAFILPIVLVHEYKMSRENDHLTAFVKSGIQAAGSDSS